VDMPLTGVTIDDSSCIDRFGLYKLTASESLADRQVVH
jgi:hypothetical protein